MNRSAARPIPAQGVRARGAAGVHRVDVVVLGGGPAGSATALALARAGRSVAVLERSRYESPRVGEALPPEVRQPLSELGVWEPFRTAGHLESPGIAVAWGRAELYDHDFLVNPYGPGWHVDRRGFDAMLAVAAEAAGAEVLTGSRPIGCDRCAGSTWRLKALVDGVPRVWHAAALVDATGRSASPVRRLGGHRIAWDRLVGLVGLVPAVADGSNRDRRTLVEAVAAGWWYSALLPDGRQVATFLTDADWLPAGLDARRASWHRWLQQAPQTRGRLGAVSPDIGLRVVSACSARLQDVAGPGWLAVGDAALSFDPLSAQGVAWALESGLAAARALDASFRGEWGALDDYAHRVGVEFRDYLRARADYYGRERRWPDSPFWRRRHRAEDAGDVVPVAQPVGAGARGSPALPAGRDRPPVTDH